MTPEERKGGIKINEQGIPQRTYSICNTDIHFLHNKREKFYGATSNESRTCCGRVYL